MEIQQTSMHVYIWGLGHLLTEKSCDLAYMKVIRICRTFDLKNHAWAPADFSVSAEAQSAEKLIVVGGPTTKHPNEVLPWNISLIHFRLYLVLTVCWKLSLHRSLMTRQKKDRVLARFFNYEGRMMRENVEISYDAYIIMMAFAKNRGGINSRADKKS